MPIHPDLAPELYANSLLLVLLVGGVGALALIRAVVKAIRPRRDTENS